MFCSVFIISVVVVRYLNADDADFDIFRIILRLFLWYCWNDLGLSGSVASFCEKFHTTSKFFVAVIRGHRSSLHNNIDRSVLLLGRKLNGIDNREN